MESIVFQKEYWESDIWDKRRPPSHPVVIEFALPKIQEIRKIVPIHKTTKLLDVGAGDGHLSYWWDKICQVTAIDFSERMIEMNPVKNKHIMNATNLRFRDNFFDVVFCCAFLHHVNDLNKIIQEMKRVSKKYIVILEPNRNNPLMFLFLSMVSEERKGLRFSLSFLKRLVKANGLKTISSFSYGLIVPNKTPEFLLPILRLFNFKFFFGITNVLICEKSNGSE